MSSLWETPFCEQTPWEKASGVKCPQRSVPVRFEVESIKVMPLSDNQVDFLLGAQLNHSAGTNIGCPCASSTSDPWRKGVQKEISQCANDVTGCPFMFGE